MHLQWHSQTDEKSTSPPLDSTMAEPIIRHQLVTLVHAAHVHVVLLLKKGEMITSEVKKGMLTLKWQDKHAVVMLSTIHDDSRVTKRRRTRLVAGGIEEV